MSAFGAGYGSPHIPRHDFGQIQQQMGRGELHGDQQQQSQIALQLPPIRTQDASLNPMAVKPNGLKDDRSSRLDIGGLLEDSNDLKTGL